MIKEQGTIELGHCVIVFRDGQAQENHSVDRGFRISDNQSFRFIAVEVSVHQTAIYWI